MVIINPIRSRDGNKIVGYNCIQVEGDYVKVVRCKDCKRQHECGIDLGQDGFCSNGERKS